MGKKVKKRNTHSRSKTIGRRLSRRNYVLTLLPCTYGQSEQQRLMTTHCDCEIDHKVQLVLTLLGRLCVDLLKIDEISQEGLEGHFVLALL